MSEAAGAGVSGGTRSEKDRIVATTRNAAMVTSARAKLWVEPLISPVDLGSDL